MKSLLGIYDAPPQHWVGDGFPVRSLFSYGSLGGHLSPFLLLDHGGPARFEPSAKRRGVGVHPHRGFETVTIVYQGEVEHRDSTGAGGRIGPGDVQWMTAGGGILHEEYHAEAFSRSGGDFHMVQLWVNLPARDKMTRPRYQTLLDADIPQITLSDDAGQVRVIAGQFGEGKGPAHSFTELDVWDLRLKAGRRVVLPLKQGREAGIVVLKGSVSTGEGKRLVADQWALASAEGEGFVLEAESEAIVLVLSGEPLDEPIVGYGPFVMNTEAEIHQALMDLRSGGFGQLTPSQ